MFTLFIFWPWFTGLVFLIGGLLLARKNVLAAPSWLDKLFALWPVFYAVPLAVFAAEYLAGTQFLMQLVPAWIPGRLFWAYFVGLALLAAATSILFDRYVSVSGTLLGIMLFHSWFSSMLPGWQPTPEIGFRGRSRSGIWLLEPRHGLLPPTGIRNGEPPERRST